MAQKFIINNNRLILGHVEYHNELLKDNSKTVGGGYWHINTETRKIYLFSKSLEFGKPKINDIISAIKSGNLPASIRDYSFYFSYRDTLVEVLTTCIKIK